MLSILLTSGLAKITPYRDGYYIVSSENIYEMASMKAERDWYRDELEKQSDNNLSLNLGMGTSKGLYAEVEYTLW